jgi:hypothetical protein
MQINQQYTKPAQIQKSGAKPKCSGMGSLQMPN